MGIDIHEFKKRFDELYKEIGHHNLTNTLSFVIRNEKDPFDDTWLVPNESINSEYYQFGIEFKQLPCGCASGLIINLK